MLSVPDNIVLYRKMFITYKHLSRTNRTKEDNRSVLKGKENGGEGENR